MTMEYGQNTIFVTGLAKPSKGDPIACKDEIFFLSLIVDRETDQIVDATCNTVRPMTEDFIRMMLVGKNLYKDMDAMVQEIRQRYFGTAQKILIVSLKDAHNRYMVAIKGM